MKRFALKGRKLNRVAPQTPQGSGQIGAYLRSEFGRLPIGKKKRPLKRFWRPHFTVYGSNMEIDTRFPTRLNTVSDAPEPLRSALVERLPSGEPVRLLVHAPAFTTGDEKSPATVLAVTNSGWLVASETENGGTTLYKSDFTDTLFFELKSILLLGQLRIFFAVGDTLHSVTIKFETVGDEFYREAIDLMLTGIDPALTGVAEKDLNEASMLEAWPMKVRNEARRYWPSGRRFLAAIHWPAVFGGSQGQLAPPGALLITERELVAISEEKDSSVEAPPEAPSAEEPNERFGGIITFVPRVRLARFHVSRHERFDVLALQLHAVDEGEKLEITFPSDQENAVSKAVEQMLLP
jgi:hypothetical protein